MTRLLQPFRKIRAVLREPDRWARRPFFARRRAFYDGMWRASAERLGAEITSCGNDIFEVRRGNRLTLVRQSDLMLDGPLVQSLLADKARTYKLFSERGIPVPDHVVIHKKDSARGQMFLARRGGEVVVKPADGTGAGRGVTTHVSTADEMTAAIALAGRFHTNILIEPQITGHSYRLSFLNGEFIQAVRRDPPMIVGDGSSTIRKLMALETQRRLSGDIIALAPLLVDHDCRNTLRRGGMTPNTYLRKGVPLIVKSVVNQNATPDNRIVSDPVHPSIIELAMRCIQDWNIGFAGVDIIATTLMEPLTATRGFIGEINVNPGIHHHHLAGNAADFDPFVDLLLDRLLTSGRGGISV